MAGKVMTVMADVKISFMFFESIAAWGERMDLLSTSSGERR